jgi:hypothetical protein
VKEKMDADTLAKAEDILKGHIEWLDTHQEEETAVYKDRQKAAEEEIRPMLMSMYGATDASADAAPGPKVDEVD